MADGDRPVDLTTAAIDDGQQEGIASPSRAGADDQMLADSDRVAARRRREQTARARLDAAAERDAIAHARDLAATARDRAAEARDLAIAQSTEAEEQETGASSLTGADVVIRAAGQRRRAAQRRAQAAEHRALAAEDRQIAARDREHAARERARALADLEALASQLAVSETDPLTGARTRAAGLTGLERELNRCRRSSGKLVVAYVGIVGLQALDDSQLHAGDALRQRVVGLIRQHLRSYDLIVRLGADEFLCAMSDVALPDARRRFAAIAAELGAAPDAAAITTGFAQLAPDDTATELIARADRQRRSGDAGADQSR